MKCLSLIVVLLIPLELFSIHFDDTTITASKYYNYFTMAEDSFIVVTSIAEEVNITSAPLIIIYKNLEKKIEVNWYILKDTFLFQTGVFEDGLPNGQFKFFFKNRDSSVVHFYNGLKEGEEVITNNGTKTYNFYNNGKKHGRSYSIDILTNKVVEEYYYKNGMENGIYTKYYLNVDVIKFQHVYFNGVLVDGKYIIRHENGVIWVDGKIKNGKYNGRFIIRDVNNSIVEIKKYKSGDLHGRSVVYYEDSKLIVKYRNGNIVKSKKYLIKK